MKAAGPAESPFSLAAALEACLSCTLTCGVGSPAAIHVLHVRVASADPLKNPTNLLDLQKRCSPEQSLCGPGNLILPSAHAVL